MTRPRTLLSGRYAYQTRLRGERDEPRWIASEVGTGRRVVALVTKPARLGAIQASSGVVHRHLAGVIEVHRSFDASAIPDSDEPARGFGVAIAEYVAGKTLHQHLAGQPMTPVKAVAWILRLADAVQALHSKGAVHGAVSPFSIVAEPEGRAIAPVLSQLVAPPVGPYCTPERLKGATLAPSDDVWALAATLYTALTARAPFEAESIEELAKRMFGARPMPLASSGIEEPVLSEVLERALTGDRRQRVLELSEFIRLLDSWERDPRALPPKRIPLPRPAPRGFIDIVGGTVASITTEAELVLDPNVLAREGLEYEPQSALESVELPPPDPALVTSADAQSLGAMARELPLAESPPLPSRAVERPRRLSFNPFERKRRVWPLVVCGAAAGGAGVYLAVGTDSRAALPSEASEVVRPQELVKAPASKPKVDPLVERNACVRSYFAEDAENHFGELGFVCEDGEFRELSRALFARAAGGSGGAAESELGWYELAATGIIRKGCCPGVLPPILPETKGWCEQLQTVVRRIAEDSAKSGDLAPAARSFDKAVTCLFANKTARPYLYNMPPSDAHRRAFQQFLSRAAISEARR